MAMGKSGDRTARAQGGFIVPYSPEYLRFRSNPLVLKDIADKTGGDVLEQRHGRRRNLSRTPQAEASSRPIFDWFLIALACLFPLDVAFRRIQIDRHSLVTSSAWVAERRLDGHDGSPPGPQADRRKSPRLAAVRRPRAEAHPEDRFASRGPATTAAHQGPPNKTAPATEKAPPPARTTTTDPLLEMKRKRQQEDKP